MRITKKKEESILEHLKDGCTVPAIAGFENVEVGAIYKIAKKNKIHLKNNAWTKYKENIVLEVRERFEKGEDFYKIAREMHLNPNSVKNILEKKIRTLKINEDLEYLKKYLSKYDVVTLVKFQNKLRRNIFIFEDTLSKVGLKIFMTKTVVNMIDLLTPEYYCDFWR